MGRMENKFREIFVKKNRYFPAVAHTSEVSDSDRYIEIAAYEQLKSKLKLAVEALGFYADMHRDDDTNLDNCLIEAVETRAEDKTSINLGGKLVAAKAVKALKEIGDL
jgi:hypothetical protein